MVPMPITALKPMLLSSTTEGGQERELPQETRISQPRKPLTLFKVPSHKRVTSSQPALTDGPSTANQSAQDP